MTDQSTIPDLDKEVEYLQRGDAYEWIKNGIGAHRGIRVRFFEPGHGEWFEYYRENPSSDGLLFYCEGEGVQKRPVRGDILSTIGRDAMHGDERVRDISLVPMKRMPEWGDGSIHYSCHVCHAAIIESERTFTTDGAAHKHCTK